MFGKVQRFLLAGLTLAAIGVALPAVARAVDCTKSANAGLPACQIQGGVTSAGGAADTTNAGAHVDNTLNTIINIFSIVVGVIAVIVLIIAGLTYITSGGNEQKVAGAKNTIVYAVVGLIIVVFAQIIVRYVINASSCDPKTDSTCPGYCLQNPKDKNCKQKSSYIPGGLSVYGKSAS